MANSDKIIDTIVDNAASTIKRVAKKAVNTLFVDDKHSKPYVSNNEPMEFVSSTEESDFTSTYFDGGWAPMDNWHELTDKHIRGFVCWDDVVMQGEDQLLTVSSEAGIYTFKVKGWYDTRFVLLEQFCNELDITYDEYREIIKFSPELLPVLIPHGEFQKLVFNRKAEKNAELLEPHYLISLSSLMKIAVKTKFTSKDAIEFKRAINALINNLITRCCTESEED